LDDSLVSLPEPIRVMTDDEVFALLAQAAEANTGTPR
jgi:hypothetical protein